MNTNKIKVHIDYEIFCLQATLIFTKRKLKGKFVNFIKAEVFIVAVLCERFHKIRIEEYRIGKKVFLMKNIFKIFKNIKTKLIFAFSLILIIPTISVGVLSYLTAKDAVKHEMLSGFNKNINLVSLSIDDTIQPKIHDVGFFSEVITSKLYKGEKSPELRKKLDQYARLHPEAESIFVGTGKGFFIQEPQVKKPADYDPREREWYKAAIENKGKVMVSQPRIPAGTDEMVVTISRTLNDNSGVVAVNLRLSYIQGLINQVKIGDKGYAFLTDKNRKYIAHPTIKAGSEAKDYFFNEIYGQEKGQMDYRFKGEQKILAFTTNKLTGWKLAGAVESSEISDAANPIFHKMLLVIVVAMIIGVVVVFMIIKSIIKPLKELKEKAITISKGDLTEQIEVQSNDEIGHLGEAFNEMQESLRVLVKEVEHNAEQVASSAEQLTASAEQTSAATEHVAASIQEVASSAEKQTTEVDKNAQSLSRSF